MLSVAKPPTPAAAPAAAAALAALAALETALATDALARVLELALRLPAGAVAKPLLALWHAVGRVVVQKGALLALHAEAAEPVAAHDLAVLSCGHVCRWRR